MIDGNKEIGKKNYNQLRSLKLSKEEEVKLNITLSKKVKKVIEEKLIITNLYL